MLCNNLHCQKVFKLKHISYKIRWCRTPKILNPETCLGTFVWTVRRGAPSSVWPTPPYLRFRREGGCEGDRATSIAAFLPVLYFSRTSSGVMQQSMSLQYEPSSETLQISAKMICLASRLHAAGRPPVSGLPPCGAARLQGR